MDLLDVVVQGVGVADGLGEAELDGLGELEPAAGWRKARLTEDPLRMARGSVALRTAARVRLAALLKCLRTGRGRIGAHAGRVEASLPRSQMRS
jgi:hypothetical protein